jgi:hypothetical protein
MHHTSEIINEEYDQPSRKTPAPRSPEKEQDQHTQGNKTRQNNPIPPPLGPNPINQPINARHLTRRPDNAAIDTGQGLALDGKGLVDGIGLTEHAVHHVVAVVDAAALLQHVVGLGRLGRVGAAVGVDVGAHVREQVLALPRFRDGAPQPLQLALVLLEYLAVPREVVLFQC